MISFVRSFLGLLFLFSLGATAAESISVRKNNGAMDTYRLMPVRLDPQHAKVFHARKKSLAISLPARAYIPADELPPIRNQGSRGTCAYFATVGILEKYYLTPSGRPRISEECLVDVRNWIFDQGKKYTEPDQPGQRPDPNGDYPTSIILTVVKNGVPAANRFSSADCVYRKNDTKGFDLSLPDYLKAISESPEAYGKDLKFDANTAPTIDDIRSLIASGVPVEVAIFVYSAFMKTADWIYNPERDTDDDIVGGHAIILTGYETANGRTVFTFKNSWDTNWGYSGFGTLDEGLLKKSWSSATDYDFIVSIH
jgi:C1A family cysteine protease